MVCDKVDIELSALLVDFGRVVLNSLHCLVDWLWM